MYRGKNRNCVQSLQCFRHTSLNNRVSGDLALFIEPVYTVRQTVYKGKFFGATDGGSNSHAKNTWLSRDKQADCHRDRGKQRLRMGVWKGK